jgi:Tfp pilus assembly protein PilZ
MDGREAGREFGVWIVFVRYQSRRMGVGVRLGTGEGVVDSL